MWLNRTPVTTSPSNGIPWPGEEESSERYTPQTLAVHTILKDWLDAIQYDKAQWRFPAPDGPVWSEEQLETMLTELDEYVKAPAQMNFANSSAARLNGGPKFDAGPEFRRLPYIQRLAMCQQLHAALRADYQEPEPEPVP